MAILSSVTGCTGEVFTRLAGDAGFRASAHGRAFLTALVGQTGVADRADDLAAVLATLDGPLAGEPALARDIVLALMSNDSPAAQARLAGAGGGRVRSILDGLLADARATAADERKPWPRGRPRSVRCGSPALPEVEGLLAESAGPAPAARTCRRRPSRPWPASTTPRVAAILLRGWPQMSPKLRATAAEALFSRPAWVGAFLDAVEKGTVGRADVDPARLELLKSYPDAAVRTRAARIFAAAQARRQDVVAAYQKALPLKGDRAARQGGLQDAVLDLPPPRRRRPAGRRRPRGDPRPRPRRRAAQHPRPQPRGDAAVPELRPGHDRRPRRSPA